MAVLSLCCRPPVGAPPAADRTHPGGSPARDAGVRDSHLPRADGPARQAAAAPARSAPAQPRRHGGALLRRPHRQRPDRLHHPIHSPHGDGRVQLTDGQHAVHDDVTGGGR